jgi:ABC-type transport system substrate-binding protein
MVLGTYQDIQHLDPHLGGLSNNRNAWEGLYNQLWSWDQGEVGNELVSAWDVSDGGLTVTITLHDGVTYHDGRAFTADDVKFNMTRLFDEDIGAPGKVALGSIDSTEVVDSSTVRFNFGTANSAIRAVFVDQFMVDKGQAEDDTIGQAGEGTGPFSLVEYVTGDRVVMTKYDGYWEAGEDGSNLPYLDGVTVRILPDATALFTALITGVVDTHWQMNPEFVTQLDADSPASYGDTGFQTGFNGNLFEWDEGIFSDIFARQALMHAIDRESVVYAGYGDLAVANPTNSNFPPTGPFTNPDVPAYEYDRDKAQGMWDTIRADWDDNKGGFPGLELMFCGVCGFGPPSLVIAKNLQDVLGGRSAKISINLAALGLSSVRMRRSQRQELGRYDWDHDGFTYPNIRFTTTEPNNTLVGWECGKHWASNFCDEELDSYSVAGRQTYDPAARKDAYFKYQTRYNAIIPAFNWAMRSITHGVSNRLHNLVSNFGTLEYADAYIHE